eukprot:gene21123-34387_t
MGRGDRDDDADDDAVSSSYVQEIPADGGPDDRGRYPDGREAMVEVGQRVYVRLDVVSMPLLHNDLGEIALKGRHGEVVTARPARSRDGRAPSPRRDDDDDRGRHRDPLRERERERGGDGRGDRRQREQRAHPPPPPPQPGRAPPPRRGAASQGFRFSPPRGPSGTWMPVRAPWHTQRLDIPSPPLRPEGGAKVVVVFAVGARPVRGVAPARRCDQPPMPNACVLQRARGSPARWVWSEDTSEPMCSHGGSVVPGAGVLRGFTQQYHREHPTACVYLVPCNILDDTLDSAVASYAPGGEHSAALRGLISDVLDAFRGRASETLVLWGG